MESWWTLARYGLEPERERTRARRIELQHAGYRGGRADAIEETVGLAINQGAELRRKTLRKQSKKGKTSAAKENKRSKSELSYSLF